MKKIVQYLIGTKRSNGEYSGLLFNVDKTKSLEVYVDASFARDWNKTWSHEPSSVLSRTGYLIFYAGCPITWLSKLQTEISLSTAESEYIALSHSLREAIPMMTFLEEIKQVLLMDLKKTELHCKLFEDNNSCIELAKCPKLCPRTKLIGLKYHHFRSKIKEGLISVHYINTDHQVADILTKALSEPKFLALRKMLNGW